MALEIIPVSSINSSSTKSSVSETAIRVKACTFEYPVNKDTEPNKSINIKVTIDLRMRRKNFINISNFTFILILLLKLFVFILSTVLAIPRQYLLNDEE